MADGIRIPPSTSRINLYGVEEPETKVEQQPISTALPSARSTSAAELARADQAARSDFTAKEYAVGGAGFFIAGVGAGAAMDRVGGKKDQSFSNFKANIRNWDNDFVGNRTGLKHNYITHGVSVGVPSFLVAKNLGASDLEAVAAVGVYATGVEFGQAFASGHKPDAGDIVRSIAVGYAVGKPISLVSDFATKKYAEEGGLGWRMLGSLTHFKDVNFGLGRDSKGKTSFTVNYSTQF